MCCDCESNTNVKAFSGYINCKPDYSERGDQCTEKRNRYCEADYCYCDVKDNTDCKNVSSDYRTNCRCDNVGSENLPPYIKYFEERDYNSIRPAGLPSSEMKQDMDSSEQKTSQKYQSGSSFREQRGSSSFERRGKGCPISISFNFDAPVKREKEQKRIVCSYPKKKAAAKRNLPCCSCCRCQPSKENTDNYWTVCIVPLSQKEKNKRRQDVSKQCDCSCNERRVEVETCQCDCCSSKGKGIPSYYGFISGMCGKY